MTLTLAARFWSKVDKRNAEDCWPWTAATNEHGYGVMRPEGQRTGPTVKAHRVSAQLAGMDVRDRMVLHACDNRLCVNPSHLRPGDAKDNSADMASRDRSVHGSRNPNARLTEPAVAIIKALLADGWLHKDVAAAFDVSRATVSFIAEGKTWRRVAPAVTPPAARDLIAAVAASLGGAS